jgi:hypothetical protein
VLRNAIIFGFGLLIVCFAHGQILDDSTELVYGPSTIQVIYENDLLTNQTETSPLDTLLNDLENFSYVDRYRHYYQDLANIGTAMFPVFYDQPEIIGARSGYHSYDPYVTRPHQRKYYDTKSPYMDLRAVFGGQGRGVIDFTYSQNINPNWNFGATVHKLNVDKQIGAEQSQGDRNVDGTALEAFTFYDHPKVPYRLMAFVSLFDHNVDETGGISVSDSASNAEIFQYEDSNIKLEDAQSLESRLDLHLYHEYGLFKQFQLYHMFDRNTQTNIYRDNNESSSNRFNHNYRTFYPNYFIDEDSTYQQSEFTSLSNEVGLKGTLKSVYYRFYARNRIVDQSLLYQDPYERVIENYIGGISEFRWRDIFAVSAQAELLQTGEFLLEASIKSDLLNASYTSKRFKQANLYQRYFGNHHEWNNDFGAGFSNELRGSLNLPWKGFTFKPFVSLLTMDDFVYLDSLSTPRQATAPSLITRAGGWLNYFVPTNREKGFGFHFENEVYLTTVSGNSADNIRIPPVFYNGRVYWSGIWFQETVPVQAGFNIHAKTRYFANDYNPAIQQFFIQDVDELKGFVAVDAFLTMKIEKVFLFLKITHANMPAENGYFVTPLYTGQKRVFDLGVRWLFFD